MNDTKIFSYDINSYELLKKEKECISNIFKIIEKNNLFSREFSGFNGYAKFFENIILEKINYPTFFSDLKKHKLFNLKEAFFEMILNKEEILIEQFIVILEEAKKYFQNDEETTIEILNLNISNEVKKRYIKINSTRIVNIQKINDSEILEYIQNVQVQPYV